MEEGTESKGGEKSSGKARIEIEAISVSKLSILNKYLSVLSK